MERMLYIGGDFMRKIFSLLILFFMCTSILVGCVGKVDNNAGDVYNYDDVKDALIRFHVIANSDTEEDQNLKLKVRDGIIEYLYPYLNKSKSIEESRTIISEKKDQVINIAKAIIKDNGYIYEVRSELSRENFPEKAYGNIILPQGNYEAFRVIIGDGQGKNWWCVMFPPLCFIDITKGKVQEEDSKRALDEQVDKFKNEEKDTEYDEEPVIKFKIVEIFESIFD
jgi:stage II sporulation protein R